MPAAVRLGDISTGHGCWPPRPNIQGSSNCFVNGKAQHRLGDAWPVHCCTSYPYPCHPGTSSKGSPNVFANGKAKSRVGDSISCGDSMAIGSPNYTING